MEPRPGRLKAASRRGGEALDGWMHTSNVVHVPSRCCLMNGFCGRKDRTWRRNKPADRGHGGGKQPGRVFPHHATRASGPDRETGLIHLGATF